MKATTRKKVWALGLAASLCGAVACGDDGETVTPTPDMTPDPNNEPNNEPNNDPNNDPNPDMPDPIEACEAVCDDLLACPELIAACDPAALEQAAVLCDMTCAANANARDQIINAGDLPCATTVPISIRSLALTDDCEEIVLPVPETYAFATPDGDSTVSYSGQTARQVLISDLKAYINGLSEDIDAGRFEPTDAGQVVSALDFYFRFDSDSNGSESPLLSTDPPLLQSTYDDISSGKDLVDKLAGNDTVTDHKDWSTEFAGWKDEGISASGGGLSSPEQLVLAFFSTIEANAIGRANGDVRTDAQGNQLPVYVTESGLDLGQLVQKFLLGAIAFHQGTDDYLDDDVEGKGLLADNIELEEGKTYTALAHAWDEGFGYFGAARNYSDYTDEEIAGEGGRDDFASGYNDTDDDGAIDLKAELNFAASVNAAKRDLGSNDATDFSGDAITAFLTGRAIIHAAAGRALSSDELDLVKAHRDTIVAAWEAALAATAIHYINDTLKDMGLFEGEGYDFQHHAKVWSELKGFALSLQFNPRSPLTDDQFAEIHNLIGDAPVLKGAGEEAVGAYRQALLDARDIFQAAYGFDAANMGDENGEGGW